MKIITKRKKILNDPNLQLRYAGVAVVVSLISVFAGWYACYTVMYNKLLPAFSISIIETTQKLSYKNLYLTCVILVPIIAIVFLFLTHRLAGAIFKIKKSVAEIEKGNIQKIELYENDDLKDIADEINKIIQKLR